MPPRNAQVLKCLVQHGLQVTVVLSHDSFLRAYDLNHKEAMEMAPRAEVLLLSCNSRKMRVFL